MKWDVEMSEDEMDMTLQIVEEVEGLQPSSKEHTEPLMASLLVVISLLCYRSSRFVSLSL